MREIDYTDSQQLWAFSLENVELAELYQEARKDYAFSLRHLKLHLAVAYRDGVIEKRMSEDKAYIMLASRQKCCHDALEMLVEKEGEYKGREKVLEARSSTMSFNQSLIKNQLNRT